VAQFPANVEYAERGEGPALLFVPGSFGTGAGWKPVMEKLRRDYRLVSTSLLGYGATAESRPLGNKTTMQQTEILDAVFERIAAPVHVVAHSFGGLSVLAHALLGKHKAESITLIEANPFPILRAAGEIALSAMFDVMTEAYFAEFAAGKPEAARHVIDFYGGAGAFDAFPLKVREYVIATTPNNIRDWSSGASFAPPLADFARIKCPTCVVRGAQGHVAMMRIAELLAANIPGARFETIEGGSHFLPATHASDLAELIASHVASTIQ
jgi:pimeloyl-ACP methyl ester carboxylesterase